jgi:hypothetical protein
VARKPTRKATAGQKRAKRATKKALRRAAGTAPGGDEWAKLLIGLFIEDSLLDDKGLLERALEIAVQVTGSQNGFLHLIPDVSQGQVQTLWHHDAPAGEGWTLAWGEKNPALSMTSKKGSWGSTASRPSLSSRKGPSPWSSVWWTRRTLMSGETSSDCNSSPTSCGG